MIPEFKDSSLPLTPDQGAANENGENSEDAKTRREIEKRAPSNDQLRALIGSFQPPPGTFDDEEMPY